MLASIVLGVLMSAGASEPLLTIERINAAPRLDGEVPSRVALSPDGATVGFLLAQPANPHHYDLWVHDVASGEARLLVDSRTLVTEEVLSDEEKARRERARLFAEGIAGFAFSKQGDRILFPLSGELYVYDLRSDEVKRLPLGEGAITDPRFSPLGDHVSFVRDQNLFVYSEADGVRALTTEGGDTLKFGMAEFVAQEEMGRMTGYWWSDDQSALAVAEVDESPVEVAERYEIGPDGFDVFRQRYPWAGTSNVWVRLAVQRLAGGEPVWIDLGAETDVYLARVDWLPDNRRLIVQRQSRDQRTLDLLLVDSGTGQTTPILTETSETWLNLHHDLRPLRNQPAFVWTSERSGFKHLYLVGLDGTVIRQLTGGNWAVERVHAVDEARGLVYFDGFADSPLEQQLYAVGLDGGQPRRISKGSGWHQVTMAEDASAYVDTFSNATTPHQVSLRTPKGKRRAWLGENALAEGHPYYPYAAAHVAPEYGTLTAADGQTLHYRLYKPASAGAGGKHPAIVHVYGGPLAQVVQKRWGTQASYWTQYMVQRGYAVFSLDNRGSGNRGKAFEDPLFRAMGGVEVDDQAEGARFLASLDWVDPERIGVYGHSYGGYMVLQLLMKHPDLYAAGAAGAPVTDWRLYDTHYTERYMDHPERYVEAYDASSVFPYVDGLNDPLLLIHGMADDNVLFTHSTRLMKELQDRGKLFELMTYPGAKHSLWGEETQNHVWNTITRFFDRELRDAPPAEEP